MEPARRADRGQARPDASLTYRGKFITGQAPPMAFHDKILGSSDQALYDAARHLLQHKLAEPHELAATFRDGVLSMWGVVGECAKVHVAEDMIEKEDCELSRTINRADEISREADGYPPARQRPALLKFAGACGTRAGALRRDEIAEADGAAGYVAQGGIDLYKRKLKRYTIF